MKISIFIRDNNFSEKEIIKEIAKEDYEEFKEDIMKGKVKFVDIDNQLIKVSEIKRIEPIKKDISPAEFRLAAPELKKVGIPALMENMFNRLKVKGLFQNYKNYSNYLKNVQE